MHNTEAVTESGRPDFRKHEMTQSCLANVSQPLHERIVDQPALDPREANVSVNRIAHSSAVRHRVNPNYFPRINGGG